jgi:hypothetical protein
MARKQMAERNGQVEQALAALLNNQAQFIGHVARVDERLAKFDERLAHIERLLMEHHEILLGLPEAIRQKIGFKSRG